MQRLRRENAKLREERDFLKKAASGWQRKRIESPFIAEDASRLPVRRKCYLAEYLAVPSMLPDGREPARSP